ncbi:hypothetical protein CBR_g11987 [Chara braunii]|uniref:mitogen-activated protein kinase kinase kinase n=1 Tax=Chara braunii TaxID=69332 RepID=A0A388KQY0_CHABU|nr:hypothetical protein CBR_g11987 [Chara braunii]|eukprot:GBG72408.1 hypothetical protein CBR_g11987 [Chara braunii]
MVNSKSRGQSAGRGSEKKQLMRLDAHRYIEYIPANHLNGTVGSQIPSPLEKVDSSHMRGIGSRAASRQFEDVYGKVFSSTDDQQLMAVPPKAAIMLGYDLSGKELSAGSASPVSTFSEDSDGEEEYDEDVTFSEECKKPPPSGPAKGQKGEDSHVANGARQPAEDESEAIEFNPGGSVTNDDGASSPPTFPWNSWTSKKGPNGGGWAIGRTGVPPGGGKGGEGRGVASQDVESCRRPVMARTSTPTGHMSTPSSPNHDSLGTSQYAPRAVSLPTSPESGDFPGSGASSMLNTRSNPGSPSNGRLPMGEQPKAGGRPTSPRPQQLPPPPLMSTTPKASLSPRQNQMVRVQQPSLHVGPPPSPVFGDDVHSFRSPPGSSVGNAPRGANFTPQVLSPGSSSHVTMLPKKRHPTKPLPPASTDPDDDVLPQQPSSRRPFPDVNSRAGAPSAATGESSLFSSTREWGSGRSPPYWKGDQPQPWVSIMMDPRLVDPRPIEQEAMDPDTSPRGSVVGGGGPFRQTGLSSSAGTSLYPPHASPYLDCIYPPHPSSPPPVTYPGVPLRPPSPPPYPSATSASGFSSQESIFRSNSEEISGMPMGDSPRSFRSFRSFTKGKKLGSGAFGTVYEAMTPDGKFYAVKELDMSVAVGSQDAQQALASLKQEVELLKRLQHPNIVQYYGTFEEDTKLYIFLECVSKGSIQNVLSLYSRLDESQIRNYTRQILEGIKYLHEHDTIHRSVFSFFSIVIALLFVSIYGSGSCVLE